MTSAICHAIRVMTGEPAPAKAGRPPSIVLLITAGKSVDADLRRHDGVATSNGYVVAASWSGISGRENPVGWRKPGMPTKVVTREGHHPSCQQRASPIMPTKVGIHVFVHRGQQSVSGQAVSGCGFQPVEPTPVVPAACEIALPTRAVDPGETPSRRPAPSDGGRSPCRSSPRLPRTPCRHGLRTRGRRPRRCGSRHSHPSGC
jgi:hypothetical protein